jgi:hypothetical protein
MGTARAWFACPHCNAPNESAPEAAEEFFNGVRRACAECNTPINWWEASLRILRENFMLTQAFAVLGAWQTMFKFLLPAGRIATVNFETNGVPKHARILAVNYTPSGPVGPTQILGQQLIENMPIWAGKEAVAYVAGIPISGTYEKLMRGEAVDVEVDCFVTWIEAPPNDVSLTNLVEAFAEYVNDQFSAAVMPAAVAIEARLSRTMTRYLERNVSAKRVEAFLSRGATFSDQLNVLLPVFAEGHGIPPLGVEIKNPLNGLRTLRNQLGHKGALANPLGKGHAAEFLTAAVFGIAYINMFDRRVFG